MMTIREHLIFRGYLPLLHHNVIIDEEGRVATFMLFAPTGKFLGYQAYKPDAPKKHVKGMKASDLKYFTHAIPGEMPFFGAETLGFDKRFVIVVEGIFDAMKFHALKLPCIAVLGNDPVRLRAYLRALGRRVIGFCDPDKAGMNLACSCDEYFIGIEGKDAGDMTHNELVEFFANQPRYKMIDGERYECTTKDFGYF